MSLFNSKSFLFTCIIIVWDSYYTVSVAILLLLVLLSHYHNSFFSPPEADFNGAVLTVTLPPGDTNNRQVDVNVPIIDDLIVEAQQTFVGYIHIQDAVDASTIMLARTATMLIINDDDDGKKNNTSSCKNKLSI